jgi:O-antigen/teichoic acid export membrane protein
MVSALQADSDPAAADSDPAVAGSPDAPPGDILDTRQAGPAVIRGGMLRVLGYGLGMVATVASSAVVIRHLGLIDTGRFTTVTAMITIVVTVSDLGLTGIAVREYAVGKEGEGQQFLRHLLGIRLLIAVSGVAIAVLFGLLVGYPEVMILGTVIAGVGALGTVAQDACSVPLQVSLRFAWVAGIQLAMQVGVALEAVLLALAGAGLLPFFAMQIPVVIPAVIVTAIIGGRDARLTPKMNARKWRGMVARILPYSAAVVLSVLYFQVAQIMVSVLSTSTQTGYFGVAFRVLLALTTVPPLLVSTALPVLARAARDDEERFAYATRRLAETMLVAGCAVALALFLGAGFAVRVVAGPGFGPAVDVLRIQAIALLGTFVIGARGYSLLSLDRLRAMMISNGIALAVVLAVGLPLVSEYGAEGAAIAMVAAELTLAVCYEIALTRDRPQLRLAPDFLLRAGAATLVAGATATALGLSSLASAVVGLAIYVVLVATVGIVPPEIRQTLTIRHDRS